MINFFSPPGKHLQQNRYNIPESFNGGNSMFSRVAILRIPSSDNYNSCWSNDNCIYLPWNTPPEPVVIARPVTKEAKEQDLVRDELVRLSSYVHAEEREETDRHYQQYIQSLYTQPDDDEFVRLASICLSRRDDDDYCGCCC